MAVFPLTLKETDGGALEGAAVAMAMAMAMKTVYTAVNICDLLTSFSGLNHPIESLDSGITR